MKSDFSTHSTRRRGRISARSRDTIRTIWHSRSRFFAIVVMTALAALVYVGISQTPHLMRDSLEEKIDAENMEDLRITSPLGFFPEDQAALSTLKNIKELTYRYCGDYFFGENEIMRVMSLSGTIDQPQLIEGRLPQEKDEILLDALALEDGRFKIGDTITFYKEESKENAAGSASHQSDGSAAENAPTQDPPSSSNTDSDLPTEPIEVDSPDPLHEVGQLEQLTFTVTGFAKNIHYLRPERDMTSMGNGKTNYFSFVLPSAFDPETRPTMALIDLQSLDHLATYDDTYRAQEDASVDEVRALLENRPQEIETQLKADAQSALEEARTQVADGKQKLKDAREDLEEAAQKLADGQKEYDEGLATFQQQTSDAQRQLDDAKARLDRSLDELNRGEDEYQNGMDEYNAGADEAKNGKAAIDAVQKQLDEAQAQVDAGRQAALGLQDPARAAQLSLLDQKQKEIDAGRATLEEQRAAYEAGQEKLQASRAALEQAREKLDAGWAEYESGLQQWQDGTSELEAKRAEGQATLDQALADLESGKQDYAEGKAKYEADAPDAEQKIAQAETDIAEAEPKIQDIQVPSHTIEGRHDNFAIHSFFDEANSLGLLSFIFPTIFYLVAMLVSLTTTMRMVEEERTQIGTLKALGYTRKSILSKYAIYASASSAAGALIGGGLGALLLTPTIYNAYASTINLMATPHFTLRPQYFFIALAVSLLVVLFAAWSAVSSSLRERAAELMRPKPPANGNRILLERIPWIWSHLSFMRKITMRNLTAKKSRMLMTILGIAGCAGLITMGFGIRDSVNNLISKQFTEIQTYDLKILYNSSADAAEVQKIFDVLSAANAQAATAYDASGHFENKKGFTESFEMYVPSDTEAFRKMMTLRSRPTGQDVALTDEGALVSEKMAEALNLKQTGEVSLQDADGFHFSLPVAGEMENYVNHIAFLSPALYEKIFKEAPEPNIILAKVPGDTEALSTALLDLDAVHAVVPMEDATDIVSGLTSALNVVVFVIIGISSTLALVVLFNLTNLNVSERLRELSTIKVLGFHSIEVTEYIYRETLLLTIVGIFFGFFAGKVAHYLITKTLAPSDVMLDPALNPSAFLLASVLTLLFSLLIMAYIHIHLKKVDMVEALKAIE